MFATGRKFTSRRGSYLRPDSQSFRGRSIGELHDYPRYGEIGYPYAKNVTAFQFLE